VCGRLIQVNSTLIKRAAHRRRAAASPDRGTAPAEPRPEPGYRPGRGGGSLQEEESRHGDV